MGRGVQRFRIQSPWSRYTRSCRSCKETKACQWAAKRRGTFCCAPARFGADGVGFGGMRTKPGTGWPAHSPPSSPPAQSTGRRPARHTYELGGGDGSQRVSRPQAHHQSGGPLERHRRMRPCVGSPHYSAALCAPTCSARHAPAAVLLARASMPRVRRRRPAVRERRGRHHPARACSERGGRARAGAGDGRSGRGGACLWRDLAGGLVSTSSCALDRSSLWHLLCLFAGGCSASTWVLAAGSRTQMDTRHLFFFSCNPAQLNFLAVRAGVGCVSPYWAIGSI